MKSRFGFVSLVAAVMLLGGSTVCRAQTFTYNFLVAATPWSTPPGVFTTNGIFSNFAAPHAPNPVTLSSPTGSVVDFLDDIQLPGDGISTGTYVAAPISFLYQLDLGPVIGGTAHTFLVTGTKDGAVGYNGGVPFSNAKIVFSSMADQNTGVVSVLSTDPNNGATALYVPVVIGDKLLKVYLDQTWSVANPVQSAVTVTGFVSAQNVPGPAAPVVALIGTGVFGALFRTRRKA